MALKAERNAKMLTPTQADLFYNTDIHFFTGLFRSAANVVIGT
jgi:hypothetical protein